MNEKLIRHEFGHEADRWNPEMLYDRAIEDRWKKERRWALEVAWNISLDARLGDGGLGRARRRAEFVRCVGETHLGVFEEAWNNPRLTFPEIEALAARLFELNPTGGLPDA